MANVIKSVFAVFVVIGIFVSGTDTETQSVEGHNITVDYTQDFTAKEAKQVVDFFSSPAVYGGSRIGDKQLRYVMTLNDGVIQLSHGVNKDVDENHVLAKMLPLGARLISDRCFNGKPVEFLLKRGDKQPLRIPAAKLCRQSQFSNRDILLYGGDITAEDAPKYIERLTACGHFGAKGSPFQIRKDADRYCIRITGDTQYLLNASEEERQSEMRATAVHFRERVALGHETTVEYCNSGLGQDYDWSVTVPATMPATEVCYRGANEVQYSSAISTKSAQQIAERLSSGVTKDAVVRIHRSAAGDTEFMVTGDGTAEDDLRAFHIASEALSALPTSIPELTCRLTNENFETTHTFSVAQRNGKFRSILGDNRIYFTDEVEEERLDRLEKAIVGSGGFSSESFGVVRCNKTDTGYCVSWQSMPSQADELEAAYADLASQIVSNGFADVDFRFEVVNSKLEVIGNLAWFQAGAASATN